MRHSKQIGFKVKFIAEFITKARKKNTCNPLQGQFLKTQQIKQGTK